MSAKPQIPLTDVRGIGPSAAVRMRQYGIQTANQLAGMSIAEFKRWRNGERPS
jgi:predicted flap endonuclease-1-like 5' DNA nuclease